MCEQVTVCKWDSISLAILPVAIFRGQAQGAPRPILSLCGVGGEKRGPHIGISALPTQKQTCGF